MTVAATTDRNNVDALPELVADVLRRPAFDEGEFAQLRSPQLTGIGPGTTIAVVGDVDARARRWGSTGTMPTMPRCWSATTSSTAAA